MQFYHIDKNGTLQTGQILSLIPFDKISNYPTNIDISRLNLLDGLSAFGVKYLCTPTSNKYDYHTYQIELVFELVRQLHFPNKPSRFQSIFCSKSFDELFANWRELIVSSNASKIVVLETEQNYSKHDANYLDLGAYKIDNHNAYSNLVAYERAFHYWNGDISSSPRLEYLVKLPVVVTETRPVIRSAF